MNNPFAGAAGGGMLGPVGNISQIQQAFTQFKQTFQGDPRQKVMELLQSGQISQANLNWAQQMAQRFAPFLK